MPARLPFFCFDGLLFCLSGLSRRGKEDTKMKISINECSKAITGDVAEGKTRILPEDMPRKMSREQSAKTHLTPLEQGIAVAEEALKSVPDTREEIVQDLKKRIESGEYKVSGEEIADMMMRRRAADRIR
jgi:flagellar biosynthesis anti-sigma factor FlgM